MSGVDVAFGDDWEVVLPLGLVERGGRMRVLYSMELLVRRESVEVKTRGMVRSEERKMMVLG